MVDVVTVVGARPQFIKCAPVSRVLRTRCSEFIIHTGQHYDEEMSAVFFREMGIPEPDINLQVGSGNHGYQTGHMLIGLEAILLKENPKIVLVYGDTNSTLAGSLAAVKLHIPVAHVEAGLRSYDRSMPEEINRVMVDHVSSLLFCPTRQAVDNLEKEGIVRNVFMTGDVMVDALFMAQSDIRQSGGFPTDSGASPGRYILSTIHRPVNTDDPDRLKGILKGLEGLPFPVILPLHPRTRNLMKGYGIDESGFSNIRFILPQSYRSMVQLMSDARAVITDSGGIQKEAYILKTPCITLRETTEWVETVQDGWNVLVGADTGALSRACENYEKNAPSVHMNRYGDGSASVKIVDSVCRFLADLNA